MAIRTMGHINDFFHADAKGLYESQKMMLHRALPCPSFGLPCLWSIISCRYFYAHRAPIVLSDSDGKERGMRKEKANTFIGSEGMCYLWQEISEESYKLLDRSQGIYVRKNDKCYQIIPCTRELFEMCKDTIKFNEAKRVERLGRCPAKGAYSQRIRCPETNRCEDCEYYHEVIRAKNYPASIEAILELGGDIAAPDDTEAEAMFNVQYAESVEVLRKAGDGLSGYFEERAEEYTQREIAGNHGMKARTLSDRMKDVKNKIYDNWH